MSESPTRGELEQAIASLEAQEALLGDAVAPALAVLRRQLADLGPPPMSTEEQRKQITVVFADVKGFTSMSETMDPEDVAAVMNGLWAAVDRVILDHGGHIDKHIGDAVMALFGAPVAREDDPERAVRAALLMQESVAAFRDAHGLGEHGLQMRIGINTGLAMLGTVGSGGEYTAIGHTVNLASRLESLAPPGGILISRPTMNHTVGLFDVVETEPVTVKGVAEPVAAFLVKRAKPRVFRVGPREVAGVQTRMIGRQAELTRLESILPASPTEQPGSADLVTILGSPGVGKSRLVYEFFNFLEGQPHPVWLFRGRAIEATRDTPYSLLRSILFDRFLIAGSDPSDVAKEKLEAGYRNAIGDDADLAATAAGHLMGFDYHEHPAIAGLLSDPRVIRERALHGLARLFEAGRGQRFLVLLIEDVQWADEDSLDMIEYLASRLHHVPALIVCTARPELVERRPSWVVENADRITLSLQPLGADDTSALIAEVLQRLGHVPDELRTLIAQRSEGNPYFLEELVKMLIDEGVIDATTAEWKVATEALSTMRIPDSLTGVVQARLDALPRAERQALQRASVVGRVFWEEAVDLLAAAAETPDAAAMADVAPALKVRELAYERSPSAFAFTREYIFKHALLHDVVYESVVRRLRRGYHREAANWLIAAGGDRAAEFASQIAEHFVEAGDDVAAIEWLVRAGTEAKSTHAPVAAAKAFGLALQLAAGTSDPAVGADRRAALGGLGDVLTVQARYEEAVDTYRALRDDAAAEGDQLSVARAESGIAAAETYQGHLRDAVDSALRARQAARRGGERNEEARAAWLQAWASLRLGMVAEATDLAADVLALSADGDRAMCAEALNLQGVIAYSGGSYDMATAHFDEAASVFEEIGNVEKVMPLLNNIGVIAEARGDYESAEKSYREALAIARETGSRDGELVYASNLGGTLVALGRAEEGESELRRVIELATDGLSVLPETYRFLTDSLLAQGRVTEATEAAVTSLRLALDSEAPDYIAAAWRALGQVASRSGGSVVVRLDRAPGSYDAEQCFAASMRTADEIDSDGDRARTLAAWAVHERRAGGPSDGGERAARARELFSGLGAEREVVRLDEALAVVGGVDR